jgi:hypothetical protein
MLNRIRLYLARALSTESRQEIFRRYALTNKWKDAESVSGAGSTLKYTENLRAALPGLFEQFRISTVLDAPCGDYNWMQHVERPGISYIGGEIVPELVEHNNAEYADDTTRFIECDILEDDLPSVDLWICRDVLFHFPEADIFRTLANLFRSDIKYILTSDHPEQDRNHDIAVGRFRTLNLMIEPFNFPEPLLWIDDWIDPYPVRRMGLWEVQSLRAALMDTPGFRDART